MATETTWQDLLQPGNATDFFARRKFVPFDPTRSDYCVANAAWLAELSRLVYRHDNEEDSPPAEPTRTSYLERVGLRQRRFFKADTRLVRVRALLVESVNENFAALIFRGTEQNIKDFLTDLRVGPTTVTKPNEASVHLGFKAALDLVWSDIETELGRLGGPVFYTGHSLGAALATLAVARRRPHATYTFGSPRVGNRLFAESLAGSPVHRVVDDQDVVTTVPPEGLGYVHVGEPHILREPVPLAAQQINLLRPPKPLADHAPVNYADRV